ncbi:hypothetical protein K438DRAFT_1758566 [Mycena galopus ATCC 62051]|nr:hypothetical protein K438DRAFT_1758566 [Mycena galopus ATCC 62051]
MMMLDQCLMPQPTLAKNRDGVELDYILVLLLLSLLSLHIAIPELPHKVIEEIIHLTRLGEGISQNLLPRMLGMAIFQTTTANLRKSQQTCAEHEIVVLGHGEHQGGDAYFHTGFFTKSQSSMTTVFRRRTKWPNPSLYLSSI